MMTSPSVSVSRRFSLKSMIQAAAALLTGTRTAVVSEPQDRRGSRRANATQKKRNGAKVNARRKTAHESRRRNRAA